MANQQTDASAQRTPLTVIKLHAVPAGMPASKTAQANLNMTIGGQAVQLNIAVPAGPTPVSELLPVFHGLTDLVANIAVQNIEREGQAISCRKGCAACCRSPVPVSESEARAIARLVERMPEPRQSEVRERFAAAVHRLTAAGLLDRARQPSWMTDADVTAMNMSYLNLRLDCPFLENETCTIYSERPIVCREFLVTSPAENCQHPSPGVISRVPMPAEVFQALRSLDGQNAGSMGWTTLTTALEWVAQHPEEPRPRSGPTWLQEAFGQLVNQANRAGEIITLSDWVSTGAIRPLLTVLGWIAGCTIGETTWDAIVGGIRESDSSAGRWYGCELVGKSRLKLRLARNPDSDAVQLRIELPRQEGPLAQLAIVIFQHFPIQGPH